MLGPLSALCFMVGARAFGGRMTRRILSAADVSAILPLNPREGRETGAPDIAPLHVRSLADLLGNPALLAPPEAVAAPFLYVGRVTLLSGREKSGKTTLAAGAAAAITTGADFLGSRLVSGPVLWISLDEALGDTVRRFDQLGADPHLLHIVSEAPAPERLRATLAATPYRLVVIDTLNELAMGRSLNESREILPILRPIVNVIRESLAAGLIIGHAGKSSGAYLGSVTIGGAVDAPLTLKRVGEAKAPPLDPSTEDDGEESPDDGRRLLVGVTRWGGKFRERLQFAYGRYALGTAPIPIAIRVLRELAAESAGHSATDLAGLLGKQKQTVLQALQDMRLQGLVNSSGSKSPNRITDIGRNHLREWEYGNGPRGNGGGTAPEPTRNHTNSDSSQSRFAGVSPAELSGPVDLDEVV